MKGTADAWDGEASLLQLTQSCSPVCLMSLVPPASCEMNRKHFWFCLQVPLHGRDFPQSVFQRTPFFVTPCDYHLCGYFTNQDHTHQRLFLLSMHPTWCLFKMSGVFRSYPGLFHLLHNLNVATPAWKPKRKLQSLYRRRTIKGLFFPLVAPVCCYSCMNLCLQHTLCNCTHGKIHI